MYKIFIQVEPIVFQGEHTFTEASGYKVGTISVADEFTLPHKREASMKGTSGVEYVSDYTFISEWIPARQRFHALGVSWTEVMTGDTKVEFLVRTRKENGDASEWSSVDAESDLSHATDASKYGMIATAWSSHVQYKLIFTSGDGASSPTVRDVKFTYIDSTVVEAVENENSLEQTGIGGDDEVFSLAGFKADLEVRKVKPVTRAEWGANESLRVFDGTGKPVIQEVDSEFREKFAEELRLEKQVKKNSEGKLLKWPLEYGSSPVEAIFIHHTASQEDAIEDSYSAVRAIYYFHAVSRGWGDVGYNYLIDDKGNVFEGRYGGSGVVGAHTSNYNVGSVGIALIGNFDETEVRFEAVRGLVNFLSDLVVDLKLNPVGVTTMRGDSLHVISGHRDAGRTACPGAHLYEKLPYIRNLVKAQVSGDTPTKSSTVTALAFETVDDQTIYNVEPFEQKNIELKLKNTGTLVWDKKTRLIYKNGQDNIAKFGSAVGTLRESKVPRGSIGTFVIPIRAGIASGLKNYYLYLESGTLQSTENILFPVYIDTGEVRFEFVEYTKSINLTLKKNTSYTVGMKVRNIGTLPWHVDSFSCEGTKDDILKSCKLSADTGVGEVGEVEMVFMTGNVSGKMTEQVRLILKGAEFSVKSKNTHSMSFTVQSSDKIITSDDVIVVGRSADIDFAPGEKKRVYVELKNSTKGAWKNVGTDRVSVKFLKSASIKAGRAQFEKSVVNRGVTSKLYFELTAPSKSGEYFVNLLLSKSGKRLNKEMIRFEFNVVSASTTSVPEKAVVSQTQATPRAVPTEVTTVAKETTSALGPKIRVKLSFIGDVILTADSEMTMYDESGKNLSMGKNIAAKSTISVTYERNLYYVRFGDTVVTTSYPVRVKSTDGIMKIASWNHPPLWNTALNDNLYRGVIEVRHENDALILVNELPLEHYVWGLGEVSEAEPTEKIKAMSIVGRTYAYYYMTVDEKFPGKKYHLDDNPDVSQKYLGYGLEQRNTKVVKLSKETSGEMVTYDGVVVKTPYFNSTDGVATKSAKEVWGWKDTPHLVSVPDPLCDGTAFSGHGVGLSGCGASGAALRGYTATEILKYYYKDIEVVKVY